MNYWLMKSEPSTWSWADQVQHQVTSWEGVRNYQAANNLKSMALGDLAFFYHSVKDKAIVGVVEVVKEYYPDANDASNRFVTVDVKALKPLVTPVNLQQIKDHPALQDLALIKQSRLSVMPIAETAWQIICNLGGI